MKRTTIMLPPELKSRAMERAQNLGISLGELIRWCLLVFMDRPENLAGDDPLLADQAVFEGEAPSDSSTSHDHYLYGDDG